MNRKGDGWDNSVVESFFHPLKTECTHQKGYLTGEEAFDIVQPHCANVVSTLKKIAGMAEMFGVECIFHGSHGMDLVYSLQVAITIRTCRTQELV